MNDQTDTKASLQRLVEEQRQTVLSRLHDEALAYTSTSSESFRRIREAEREIINALQALIKQLWPFCSLEVFGSHASGLVTSHSDVDLVACFSDSWQGQGLLKIRGIIPVLQTLADFLNHTASHLITIKKVLFHTRVPLIKAEAQIQVMPVGSSNSSNSNNGHNNHCNSNDINSNSSGNDSMNSFTLSIDISIDSPAHSGLATTAMVQTLSFAFPALFPATAVLKAYLKSKGLCDAYTGGLSSYGLTLLLLLLLLRRHRASKLPSSRPPSATRSTSSSSATTIISAEEMSTLSSPSTATNHSSTHTTTTTTSFLNSPSPSSLNGNFPVTLQIASPLPQKAYTSVSSNLPPTYLSPLPLSPPSQHITQLSDPSLTSLPIAYCPSGCYSYEHTWFGVQHQKEFGKRVAVKLLGLSTDDVEGIEMMPPLLSNTSPAVGILIVDFLAFYGDDCELWKHGFSLREGGFRFDVKGEGRPTHPQAEHPVVVEDPVNVMNNVASNCFNAIAVQTAFQEALSKFRAYMVRHQCPSRKTTGKVNKNTTDSRRNSQSSTVSYDPSLITEMFGLPSQPINQVQAQMTSTHHPPHQSPVSNSSLSIGYCSQSTLTRPDRLALSPMTSSTTRMPDFHHNSYGHHQDIDNQTAALQTASEIKGEEETRQVEKEVDPLMILHEFEYLSIDCSSFTPDSHRQKSNHSSEPSSVSKSQSRPYSSPTGGSSEGEEYCSISSFHEMQRVEFIRTACGNTPSTTTNNTSVMIPPDQLLLNASSFPEIEMEGMEVENIDSPYYRIEDSRLLTNRSFLTPNCFEMDRNSYRLLRNRKTITGTTPSTITTTTAGYEGDELSHLRIERARRFSI